MKNNKVLWELDAKYKKLFRRVIGDVIRKYPGIPVEWEDIYYDFLYTMPEVMKGFNPEKGISESTYYGLQLKFFASNKCRHYASNKFRSLNETTLIENDNSLMLSDSGSIAGSSFDLSSLTDWEMIVYERNILNYESLRSISDDTKIQYRYIRKAFASLKRKMLNQIL